MAKTSKRSNRGWWWNHFVVHPVYAVKDPASMISRKAKVVCAMLYEQRIAHEQAIDEQQVHAGQRDTLRDEVAIAGTLWASGQNDPQCTWLHRWNTTNHIHREKVLRPIGQTQFQHISVLYLQSFSLILYRDSPSVSPSPALFGVSLPSHLKRQRLIQSGQYYSIPGLLPPLSPVSLGNQLNGFGDQAWTASGQANWEIGLARLTASAGLPLRWVENHEWKVLCDRFLLRAIIPSAKVLTQRVLPHALSILKGAAKEECQGADTTLQCDGWTGENHHHLLGFMMTAR
ncbi:hypothetical protein BDR07DRAFT_1374249 [Suillus spraguei]|nr:hypothetical protein BDR07DRAFT_1374249 [Suillus spraguei]